MPKILARRLIELEEINVQIGKNTVTIVRNKTFPGEAIPLGGCSKHPFFCRCMGDAREWLEKEGALK